MKRKLDLAMHCNTQIDIDLRKFLAGYTREEMDFLRIDESRWIEMIEKWESDSTKAKNPFRGNIWSKPNVSCY